MKDPYDTLGVKPGASAAEIKKAYRRLAKKYHPDSTGGDKAKESKFKDVSTAYDIVGDADKRKQFDAMKQGGFAGIPGADGGNMDLGDLFAQMFGAARPGSRASRGGGRGQPDVEYRVYQGGGQGGFAGFPDFGAGYDGRTEEPRLRQRPRPVETAAERTVIASDGSKLSLRGGDVHSDVRLAIDQAVLGAVVEVATLVGKASVKIPPGTSSGMKLRLKGKGARGSSGEVGDHLVTVQIDAPKHLDDEAKRLLVEFMQRTRRHP